MLIPDRLPFAKAGIEFCDGLPSSRLDPVREKAILEEFVDSSNVPDFYRNFVDVQVGDDTGSTAHSLVIRVAPDYLCIGNDDDYVRIPTNPLTAQKLADLWGCVLPTKKMVDLIWRHASIKLAPRPLPPTAQMTSVEWFKRSNVAIQIQLAAESSFALGQLIGGHKKDVVITSKTFKTPKKVAIYGWHQKNGVAIQGPGVNGSSHEETYADYSHGIRMIDSTVVLDGTEMSIFDVLKDTTLCKYLSEEGTLENPKYKI